MVALSLLGLVAVTSLLWQSSADARAPVPPFQAPFLPPTATPQDNHLKVFHNDTTRPLRVAIIGGGASGTSCAFFLSEIARKADRPLSLRLFERRDYLGGRSTVLYPFNDSSSYEPIEAGASIFVPANLNLHKAVRDFGLKTMRYGGEKDGGRLGIWNGEEMVWEESTRGGWWDKARMFWRYGRALMQLRSLTSAAVDNFLKLYKEEFARKGPFATIPEMAAAIGDEFRRLPTMTGTEYLIDEQGVSPLAVNELVAVAARTNYGTDINEIHALGALVSLAASNAVSVRGGNRQIFSSFASHSGAKVSLNVEVTTIAELETKDGRREYSLEFKDARAGVEGKSEERFDVVVVAAPYSQAHLNLITTSPLSTPPPQPYVNLHVTFLTTNSSSPSAEAFNRKGEGEGEWPVPKTVLSTMMNNVEGRGVRPRFNSLSYLRNLGPREGVDGDVHMIKMFSESELDDAYLSTLFSGPQNLLWTHRLLWPAYPFLSPVPPPLESKTFAPLRLAPGLYYPNAFERLCSTMETSTVSSWNVAGLIARESWGYRVDRSWAEWDVE